MYAILGTVQTIHELCTGTVYPILTILGTMYTILAKMYTISGTVYTILGMTYTVLEMRCAKF